MAKQWKKPATATVKYNVALNENGQIAQSGDTAAANTAYSMKGIATDASEEDSSKTFGAFVTGLAGGRFDESSGKKIVEYTVADVEG